MAEKKKHLPEQDPTAVNASLSELEAVDNKVQELQQQREEILDRIRQESRQAAVVFIDMVGSTQFKIDHADEPELWIRRVKLFCDLIREYVERLHGRVVKYIGDEVMAVFDGEECVNDASSLVARIGQIEEKLASVIGVETRIKIAIDTGEVSFFEFEGHDEFDPQGTPVDRCARIAKYAEAGTVVASYDYVEDCPGTFHWTKAGDVALKGLGTTSIYQMGGEVTIDVTPKTEIPESELQELRTKVQELTLENKRLRKMNEGLQAQIDELGEKPATEHSLQDDEEDDWGKVQEDIDKLKALIEKARAPSYQYARFLFLERADLTDDYDSYSHKFDESIEAQLVYQDGSGGWCLDPDHPLNQAALSVMGDISEKLEDWGPDEDEYYNYSLDDPQFWEEKIGYDVTK